MTVLLIFSAKKDFAGDVGDAPQAPWYQGIGRDLRILAGRTGICGPGAGHALGTPGCAERQRAEA